MSTVSYQQLNSSITGQLDTTIVQRTDANGVVSTVPIGAVTGDSKAYAAWLAAGNTPTPPAS